MIIYESNTNNQDDNKIYKLTKEQYKKRKESLLEFNKELKKHIKIIEEREYKSLEYSRHKFVK